MRSKTLAIVIPFLAACAAGPDTIDGYVRSIDHLPSEPSVRTEGEPSAPEPAPNMVCVTQPIHETRQHDQVVALTANSQAMWPGALVRGDAVYSGLFTPIALPRAPQTFSISLAHLEGAHSATLASPSLSSYREAIAQILAQQVTGATPANLAIDIEKIDTEQQVQLALGAGASWGGLVDVKASFNWSATSQKSRYLVKFVQSYYTVDVDAPARPADVFDPSVTLEDVEAVAGDGNPPVYVSSITYGRMVVFTFESDTTSEDLGGALEAMYHGPGGLSGSISVKDRDVLSQSRISAYILGGAGGDAVQAVDSFDSLLAFIQSGGDYSPASPGAPIAYKLAHLADNVPARLSFTQDYALKNCTANSGSARVTLESITLDGSAGELDSTIELYGVVTVATSNGTSGLVLLQLPSGSPLVLGNDETWPASGALREGDILVSTDAGAFLDICVTLWDEDAPSADDFLGNVCYRIDLDGGWQRDFDVLLTGTGKRLLLHMATQPL